MIRKLILFLYRKRIKRLHESYEREKEIYFGKHYLKTLKTKINIILALKQQLLIPDFNETYSVFVEALANFFDLIVSLIVILVCPFYNIFKLLIFPFRIYIVKAVRKEILNRIEANND